MDKNLVSGKRNETKTSYKDTPQKLTINKQKAILRRQEFLFKNVIWFENKMLIDKIYFDDFKPQRQISGNTKYIAGSFPSEKCLRNIQYESGIEFKFICDLEQMPDIKFYYEQPITIEFRHNRKKYRYTPDFIVFKNTGEVFIVEIKELSQMLDIKVQRKLETLCEFCNSRGFGLLFTNGRSTIDSVLSGRYNMAFEKELMLLLKDNKVLNKKDYEKLRSAHKAGWKDLLKIIVKNDLHYNSFPFKLSIRRRPMKLFKNVFIKKDTSDVGYNYKYYNHGKLS